MHNTSEVILRNGAALGNGPLLLVNPPRDSLASKLRAAIQQTGESGIRASTQHHGDFLWLGASGVSATFDLVPEFNAETGTTILVLPREKERFAMMLHAISTGMPATGRLLVVGENRAGIKSAPATLKRYFGSVQKLDSARHCGLFQASHPATAEPFKLEDWQSVWTHDFGGRAIHLHSLPGVFAHGRLDRGTEILLGVLEELQPRGNILDFACGCGVLASSLLAAGLATQATLLDVSSLALEASRQTLAANGREGNCLASDGLAEVNERYDWIISNPPFHQGIGNDLEIARDFFRQAGTFLRENGRILIVFNRHLPYTHWIKENFASVDCLVNRNDFTVISAGRPLKNPT